MWVSLAFLSALMLGLYDVAKKRSLKENAVLPVLWLNTLFSTIIFLPALLDSAVGGGWLDNTLFETTSGTLRDHAIIVVKAAMVLSSWIFGYFGLKHLPLTLVGPINATRPVLVLVGATLIFGEQLNAYQWAGVLTTILSIFMMSRAGKKENIDFKSNKWIWCVAGATIMGAVSGLYDKFVMRQLSPMFVQSWFNLYQMLIMIVICALLWYPTRHKTTPFRWSWAIPLISIFICLADFAYYTSLSDPDSMISVVSLVRRSSVIISFLCAAIIFRERNLRAKALDLVLILLGMALIRLGTAR